MAIEMRTELTDDSICTLSFSLRLTMTGVISSSLLLLYTKQTDKLFNMPKYGH